MISRISIHFNIIVRFMISCNGSNSLIFWLRSLGILNGIVCWHWLLDITVFNATLINIISATNSQLWLHRMYTSYNTPWLFTLYNKEYINHYGDHQSNYSNNHYCSQSNDHSIVVIWVITTVAVCICWNKDPYSHTNYIAS